MITSICFHGVGSPGPGLEEGASEYFVGHDLFLRVLDDVAGQTAVELSFDDGYASDIQIALPALVERGLTARFFPLAGRLGAPGHVDEAGVRELASAGMTIGSHGMNHRSWRGLDPAAARAELSVAQEMLAAAADAPVTIAACPFGLYDRGTLRALHQHGYRSVFTSDRRRARPGAWLQPRYSVTAADTLSSVRDGILAPPGLRQRARAAVAAQVKAWR